MSLNESKGNMYEFITHTWNAIKGRCLHDCSYCYMKRWGVLNPVRLDEKEFKTDLGKDNFIFVGSSTDMFANDVPTEWIVEVLNYCGQFNNKYLFQTKNPARLIEHVFWMPDNSNICITLESDIHYPEIMNESPTPAHRVGVIKKLALPIYITIEPILDFNFYTFIQMIESCKPIQVNIGADSGGNNLPEPSKDKVLSLVNTLENRGIKVVLKKNLNRIIK